MRPSRSTAPICMSLSLIVKVWLILMMYVSQIKNKVKVLREHCHHEQSLLPGKGRPIQACTLFQKGFQQFGSSLFRRFNSSSSVRSERNTPVVSPNTEGSACDFAMGLMRPLLVFYSILSSCHSFSQRFDSLLHLLVLFWVVQKLVKGK